MFDILNFHLVKMNDSLPDVVDVLLDDAAPHQHVREQEEVSLLALILAPLHQESLSQENSGSIIQHPPCRAKHVLNHLDSVTGG